MGRYGPRCTAQVDSQDQASRARGPLAPARRLTPKDAGLEEQRTTGKLPIYGWVELELSDGQLTDQVYFQLESPYSGCQCPKWRKGRAGASFLLC